MKEKSVGPRGQQDRKPFHIAPLSAAVARCAVRFSGWLGCAPRTRPEARPEGTGRPRTSASPPLHATHKGGANPEGGEGGRETKKPTDGVKRSGSKTGGGERPGKVNESPRKRKFVELKPYLGSPPLVATRYPDRYAVAARATLDDESAHGAVKLVAGGGDAEVDPRGVARRFAGVM
ncbi:MAG: hypothetical protein BJ554DRAFT_1300, partial [Olpidium bornovanus]